MNRNRFLSLAGLSFLGTVFSASRRDLPLISQTDCADPITPPVPEGPYYKDEKMNRSDITEGKKGTPVDFVFRVEDAHCKPIAGAIVDIWHCDAEGHYSDFEAEHTLRQTWLRGYQVTDHKGECRFHSVFPGWYEGRITHLHGKVHVNGKTMLTTNFFFPKEIEDQIFQSPLYPKGPNPVAILQDYELRVDKDTHRHDTLVMQMKQDRQGKWIARYTVALV